MAGENKQQVYNCASSRLPRVQRGFVIQVLDETTFEVHLISNTSALGVALLDRMQAFEDKSKAESLTVTQHYAT